MPPLPASIQPFYLAGVLDRLTGAEDRGAQHEQANLLAGLAYQLGWRSVADESADPEHESGEFLNDTAQHEIPSGSSEQSGRSPHAN